MYQGIHTLYKAFCSELTHIVHKTMNSIYHDNELPDSLRFGIVHIIPKGQKDQRHLSNWRPLTLLNTLYKFLWGRVLCATQGFGASRLDLSKYYMNLLKLTCLDLTWPDLTQLDLTWFYWSDFALHELTWLDLTWLDLTWKYLTTLNLTSVSYLLKK